MGAGTDLWLLVLVCASAGVVVGTGIRVDVCHDRWQLAKWILFEAWPGGIAFNFKTVLQKALMYLSWCPNRYKCISGRS